MRVISKSLKTKFRQILCPRGESRLPWLVTQLISELPVKAGGAAPMLSALGRALGTVVPRRAITSYRVVAIALLLDSSHGRPAFCRCWVCIPPRTFFMCKCNFLPSGLLHAVVCFVFFFFFTVGLRSVCPLASRHWSCVCNFIKVNLKSVFSVGYFSSRDIGKSWPWSRAPSAQAALCGSSHPWVLGSALPWGR